MLYHTLKVCGKTRPTCITYSLLVVKSWCNFDCLMCNVVLGYRLAQNYSNKVFNNRAEASLSSYTEHDRCTLHLFAVCMFNCIGYCACTCVCVLVVRCQCIHVFVLSQHLHDDPPLPQQQSTQLVSPSWGCSTPTGSWHTHAAC